MVMAMKKVLVLEAVLEFASDVKTLYSMPLKSL